MRRKKDYQKKNFQNPFFPKTQKLKRRLFKRFWLILIIFIIAGLYFLNSADQLRIENIEVAGNEYIKGQDIESVIWEQTTKKRWFLFSQSNIVFFSKNSAKKALAGNYFFDQLSIKKKYPDTLEVKVKEKISSLLWVSGGGQYYLDLRGIVIRKLTGDDLLIKAGEGQTDVVRSEASSGRYPLIYDQSNTPVEIGQPAVSPKVADFIVNLTNQLNTGADFDISHYNIVGPDSREIILVTNEGWAARFNLEDSVRSQGDLLLSILYQKVEDRNSLEYIDLRFGDKVFWK